MSATKQRINKTRHKHTLYIWDKQHLEAKLSSSLGLQNYLTPYTSRYLGHNNINIGTFILFDFAVAVLLVAHQLLRISACKWYGLLPDANLVGMGLLYCDAYALSSPPLPFIDISHHFVIVFSSIKSLFSCWHKWKEAQMKRKQASLDKQIMTTIDSTLVYNHVHTWMLTSVLSLVVKQLCVKAWDRS